jgi:hypothetical protein
LINRLKYYGKKKSNNKRQTVPIKETKQKTNSYVYMNIYKKNSK